MSLSNQEIFFCELYAAGDAPFAGDAKRCYNEAFGTNLRTKVKAEELLAKESIQDYLNSLEEHSFEEPRYMKKYIASHLMSIIDECSVAEYKDRRGTTLSPAPLRSVAVNATKALADLYPVKEAQTNKLSIESEGGGGITFNVVMPDQTKVEPKLEESK